jgi:RNA polymerase sigma-70 factor (ECF subfamily)
MLLPRRRNVVTFPVAGESAQANVPADRRTVIKKLFEEHHDRLVRFLTARFNAAEAQDAAQEAYVHLLQRESTHCDENIRGLLYVTARNIAIDHLRKRRRHESADGAAFDSSIDLSGPDRILGARQELNLLQAAIAGLPEDCRYAFIRYKLHGAEYGDIARELQVTESMVRKHVLRAVARCASRLNEMDSPS